MSNRIFPWEKDFDLDRLAEEYAEINGWDLEKCRQEIYQSMIQVARDLEPGRWISSEMAKLTDMHSQECPFKPREHT